MPHYVYLLSHPTTGRIRWVGISTGDPVPEHDERIGLTAAGFQAANGSGDGGAPAIFFVAKDPGSAFVTLRAAGNAAAGLLAALERGDRVEVRIVPPVNVDAPRPLTEAGERAGWA